MENPFLKISQDSEVVRLNTEMLKLSKQLQERLAELRKQYGVELMEMAIPILTDGIPVTDTTQKKN